MGSQDFQRKRIFGVFQVLFNVSKGKITEGGSIPAITLSDHTGKKIDLEQYGGQWVVLYFYPKDDTPGCTKQANSFSDHIESFEAENVQVFGVSTDKVATHQKFHDKYNLRFPLISDEDGKVAKLFGIRIMFGLCSRDLVLINPEGKVEKIYKGVQPEASAEKVLRYIQLKS